MREHVLVREHVLERASHPCTKRNSAFPEEEEEEEESFLWRRREREREEAC